MKKLEQKSVRIELLDAMTKGGMVRIKVWLKGEVETFARSVYKDKESGLLYIVFGKFRFYEGEI